MVQYRHTISHLLKSSKKHCNSVPLSTMYNETLLFHFIINARRHTILLIFLNPNAFRKNLCYLPYASQSCTRENEKFPGLLSILAREARLTAIGHSRLRIEAVGEKTFRSTNYAECITVFTEQPMRVMMLCLSRHARNNHMLIEASTYVQNISYVACEKLVQKRHGFRTIHLTRVLHVKYVRSHNIHAHAYYLH